MKVLYIGNYRDGTGWSQAAINYIMAMDSVGIDIVPRFIKLNNTDGEIPERIKELEAKSDRNCDVVIQHVLPHMLDYSGNFKKNIAMCAFETSNFNKTPWASKINSMDELWVFCRQSQNIAVNSNIKVPITIVPHTFDIQKFEKKYDRFDFPELRDKFVFYFIGELVRRKNLEALLIAFHTEFTPNENVGLLLKANAPGATQTQTAKLIQEFTENIKKGLKIYPKIEDYIGEIGFAARLSDTDMYKLHNSCDCFVMPSYAEAFCIPAFEAMAMGKPVIANDVGGMTDYLPLASLVPNREEPIYNMMDTFNELGTGHENWWSIDILKLRQKMRHVFERETLRTQMSEEGIDNSYNYSYQIIGNKIKELLEC